MKDVRLIILEQSGTTASSVSRSRIAACRQLGISHRRLNWNQKLWNLDPDAQYHHSDVTWSEGRSLLFEEAQKEGSWEYYLFVDDDVILMPRAAPFAHVYEWCMTQEFTVRSDLATRFAKRSLDFAVRLAPYATLVEIQVQALISLLAQLRTWEPISGMIYSPSDWGLSRIALGKSDRPRCIASGDLQTRIMSREFAEKVFPALVPGSAGSMWYTDFLAHSICPHRALLITSIAAVNSMTRPHMDGGLPQFRCLRSVLEEQKRYLPAEQWENWVGDGMPPQQHLRAHNVKSVELQPKGRSWADDAQSLREIDRWLRRKVL